MMEQTELDNYLAAFAKATDLPPSRQVRDRILAVPDQMVAQKRQVWNPVSWFDMLLPKAIGWSLTCVLGIYVGLTSSEQVGASLDDEIYYYEQTQQIIAESLSPEETDQ